MKTFTRRVLSFARVIMPVSGYLQKLMHRHGLRGNYQVVPNVVDTTLFSPKPQTDFSNKLIHVSALDDAQKNVSGIIDAFAAAKRRFPSLELEIIGKGPDEQVLRRKAETVLPGGGITFKGQLSPREVAEGLKSCDVLVMFSNYETFCVAVPEALACGVPVITSDAGGIMSYFNEALGYVVPKGNTAALTNAICEFYEQKRKFDPAALHAFVKERFAQERVSALLHSVYESVLPKL